ncbi:hypothetical protein VA7868_04309 [Vibrio aerogenes CECT 7868]|uniref:DUF3581 domain-containing protein n=1 Tax=Vibrio aerogenes CECT 7868 TaxID=1216006 RepID=A0A1M6DSY3_9VIBR|nr:DUF3581 domain-containing protein [Vibrio aerogenes]SHI76249.1 hypothetical protein VA7868_04309 [Vibrio aerogenes CECT 7868]
MFLAPYFSTSQHQFQFTRQQASHFAKRIAGDFNPIHDEDNKRFCVPGDLLFAVLLKKEGISQRMSFNFSGMVNANTALKIEKKNDKESAVIDENGKEYLHMRREGEMTQNQELIQHLVTSYVQFSGMNFPYILVPLMQKEQVMINCERPLVIYESMDIDLEHLDLSRPEVELADTTFDVEGKRGAVELNFQFKNEGQLVGKGVKRMVVSGLRPYNQSSIDALIQKLDDHKTRFMAQFAPEVA